MGQFDDLKGKPLGGLGDGNGESKDKSGSSTTINEKQNQLQAPDVPNKDYFERLVNITKKTVRQEDALIRQIHLTAFSAELDDPINLAVIAPTSEGKTHPIIQALSYHPEYKIWYIGSMSTKVLVRKKGILVDSNNEPITPKIREIRRQIAKEKDSDKLENLKEELSDLYSDSRHLIDLAGITLVFLEPPHYDLWELIKPILSHDKLETTHDYVDNDKPRGIDGDKVQKVITRGFPACIFCSAKDESKWEIWPEIQSRFLITSPNMIKQKYEESTTLIAQRKGLPSFIKNQVIVSNQDIELAKQCALYIKQELRKLSQNKIDVWIPYYDIIARALKSDKGTDVRHSNRIFTLLNMIPLVKCTNRQILSIGKNPGSIIATLEDLSHVLAITQNLTGLPGYKIKFFKEIFYPLWRKKTVEDVSPDGTKHEDGVSVTTKELREKYKSKYGKITTTDNLKKTFLNELHNNGFIEEEMSVINNKQYVYKPLVAGDDDDNEKISISFISNSGQFDNVLQHSRLLVPKNYILPPENWLELQISEFKLCRIDETSSSDFIKLEDIHILNSVYDGNDGISTRIPINEFISKYEQHVPLIRYVKSADFSNNHNKTDTNAENKTTSDSKDVKAHRIESNSISKISSSIEKDDPSPKPKPEPEPGNGTIYEKPNICRNCHRMISPFNKNIHLACCHGSC